MPGLENLALIPGCVGSSPIQNIGAYGTEVGEFIHTFGDAHLYLNHIEQIELQLSREPFALPKLVLKHPEKSIFEMEKEDIVLEGYKSHPGIKAPIAV